MKKHLRITLTKDANNLCEKLAALAAKFNGGEKQYNLENLEIIAKSEMLQFPSLNADMQATLYNHALTIDRKVGESYVTVADIQEIDIFEIEQKPEAE